MLKLNINLILTTVLIVGLPGCRVFSEGKPAVVVEEVSLIHKEGVELESISAVPSAFSINESTDLSDAPSSARVVPERFFMIHNKSIMDALKSKIGTNYLALEEKFQSAIENGMDPSRYPELGVEYQFKPQIDGVEAQTPVCFKLREAFEGMGVLIAVRGSVVRTWSGNPRLALGLLQDQPLMIDLFDSKFGVSVFRVGKDTFFGFPKKPGGSVFLLVLSEDQFKLTRSVSSMPAVPGAVSVYPDRMNPFLSKVLGPPTASDGFLVYFMDERQEVVRIYHMDRHYVFKDVSASCSKISQNELLPALLNCKTQSASI